MQEVYRRQGTESNLRLTRPSRDCVRLMIPRCLSSAAPALCQGSRTPTCIVHVTGQSRLQCWKSKLPKKSDLHSRVGSNSCKVPLQHSQIKHAWNIANRQTTLSKRLSALVYDRGLYSIKSTMLSCSYAYGDWSCINQQVQSSWLNHRVCICLYVRHTQNLVELTPG